MGLDVILNAEKCDKCGHEGRQYHANITHNLIDMAKEAGIYYIVWRPEESGIAYAAELIKPLEEAIFKMKSDPERFKKHNSTSGWGLYDDFVLFLEKYLQACKKMPDAEVFSER